MNFVSSFGAELDALINPGSAFRIARDVYSRPQLAEKISGAPRGSKAYKAALRNVERYEAPAGKQRRTPSEQTKARLAEILKQDESVLQRVAGHVRVNVSGEFVASETRRFRSVTFSMHAEDVAKAFKDARAGREDELYDNVFMSYGFVPDAVHGMQVRFV